MEKIALDIKGIREYVENRKVICYGAGLQGRRAMIWFENWGLWDKIIAFSDSDSRKWGTTMKYGLHEYPLVSIDNLASYVDGETLLLICALKVNEIVEQLNQISFLKSLTYTSLVDIAERQLLVSDYDFIVRESDTPIIPKKIHYCWLGKEMPDYQKKLIERWHEVCPEYEIIEWNDTNYDFTKNAYMRQAYENEVWGFVPDYARLDIVHQHGGFYFDTDVEILRSPDELLYQRNMVMRDATLLVNLGAGFGAVPGDPMIKMFRDAYDEAVFIKEDGSFDKTTCQLQQYEVLKKYGFRIDDSYQEVNGLHVYPMVMQGTCSHSQKMTLSKKAFFAHYGASSWGDASWRDAIKKKSAETIVGLVAYSI